MHDGVLMYNVYVRDYVNDSGNISATHYTYVMDEIYLIYLFRIFILVFSECE